nr:helix-turn-helix transcriptional regulator [Paeniclostridium sordellii]
MSIGGVFVKSRLKEIRNSLGLSQKDFGAKLCLSQDHISSLENGRRKITDRTIKDICDEFNINEKWLRTGEGKIKKDLTEDIDAPDEIKALLKKFFLLNESDQKKLEFIIDSFIEEEQKKEED